MALDIGGPYVHLLDCTKVGADSAGFLTWVTNGNTPRFPISNEMILVEGINSTVPVRRLNFTRRVSVADLGTYTCRDTMDGETLSVLLAESMYVSGVG